MQKCEWFLKGYFLDMQYVHDSIRHPCVIAALIYFPVHLPISSHNSNEVSFVSELSLKVAKLLKTLFPKYYVRRYLSTSVYSMLEIKCKVHLVHNRTILMAILITLLCLHPILSQKLDANRAK